MLAELAVTETACKVAFDGRPGTMIPLPIATHPSPCEWLQSYIVGFWVLTQLLLLQLEAQTPAGRRAKQLLEMT